MRPGVLLRTSVRMAIRPQLLYQRPYVDKECASAPRGSGARLFVARNISFSVATQCLRQYSITVLPSSMTEQSIFIEVPFSVPELCIPA